MKDRLKDNKNKQNIYQAQALAFCYMREISKKKTKSNENMVEDKKNASIQN